jgi:hypothetical protein
MSFKHLAPVLLLLATPAAAFETGTATLTWGSLDGEAGSFSGTRATAEIAHDPGPWGLQLGVALSTLTDADQNSARGLLWRDVGAGFSLALSAARTSDDGAQTDNGSLAFHILRETPGSRIDASIALPDHLDDTGAFSYDISGVQRLSPRLDVVTDLYRLTTDEEFDDFWSISLGLRYAATDRLTLAATAIRSTADDFNFNNHMARLGADWALTDSLTASATVLHLVTVDDGTQTGLELALRRDFGARRAPFDGGPLTDRITIGAFEP